MRIARIVPGVLLFVSAAVAAQPKPVTFSVPARDFFIGSASAPVSVAVADLNGDGFPDAITANAQSGNVSVLLGDGQGGFQPAKNYAAGSNPYAIVAGDFTEWEKRPIELTKSDGGKWQVKLPLPKGRQQYRFIVDGEWHDDPACKEKVRNNFGSTNAVIQVARGD